MPLIKTIGNLTIEDSIMIVLGVLAGAAEKISPRELKQKAANISPKIRMTGWDTLIPIASPIIRGMKEMAIPKAKDASTSPRTIVGRVTGQDISLSSVLACVSQGATAGEIAVAVKKRTIPRRPGSMKSRLRFLPMAKERNKNSGKRMPKIITGPLE